MPPVSLVVITGSKKKTTRKKTAITAEEGKVREALLPVRRVHKPPRTHTHMHKHVCVCAYAGCACGSVCYPLGRLPCTGGGRPGYALSHEHTCSVSSQLKSISKSCVSLMLMLMLAGSGNNIALHC